MGVRGRSFRSFLGGDGTCSPPSLPLPANLGLSPDALQPFLCPRKSPHSGGSLPRHSLFPTGTHLFSVPGIPPHVAGPLISVRSQGMDKQWNEFILIGEWVIAAQTPRVVNEIQRRTFLNGTLIGLWGTALPTELSGKPRVECKHSKVPGCDWWRGTC